MFGGASGDAVRLPYTDFVKPGVRLLRETVTAIDPEAKRVTTDAGVHEADFLVIALGADFDLAATPGLAEVDSEFYSVAGAEKLARKIPSFSEGRALIGVCGAPFKCPPAPSECALLLDDELRRRGVREACEIAFVIPFGNPVPPSPETSAALRAEFERRRIELVTGRRIASLDPERRIAVLVEGTKVPKPWSGDAVVAAHGSWDRQEPRAPAVLWLPWDAKRRTLLPAHTLVSGFQNPNGERWGRPVDVVPGAHGELYVSDDTAGAVYKLTPPRGSLRGRPT
jgi:NADPH-dependent 2,4-dienoyl-CoA reductase/sulfur reductase-like enzyme